MIAVSHNWLQEQSRYVHVHSPQHNRNSDRIHNEWIHASTHNHIHLDHIRHRENTGIHITSHVPTRCRTQVPRCTCSLTR